MVEPVVRFQGRVVNRSGGKPELLGSKSIMEKHPEWPEYIRSFTGWSRVEPGTLTLDGCDPPPFSALKNVTCLATDPDPETLFKDNPGYSGLMRRRGTRRYYAAIGASGDRSHVVIVSYQEHPARQDRLELYADERLRDALEVDNGDMVLVNIYNRDDWIGLQER